MSGTGRIGYRRQRRPTVVNQKGHSQSVVAEFPLVWVQPSSGQLCSCSMGSSFLSHSSRTCELHLTEPDYTTPSCNGWPGEEAWQQLRCQCWERVTARVKEAGCDRNHHRTVLPDKNGWNCADFSQVSKSCRTGDFKMKVKWWRRLYSSERLHPPCWVWSLRHKWIKQRPLRMNQATGGCARVSILHSVWFSKAGSCTSSSSAWWCQDSSHPFTFNTSSSWCKKERNGKTAQLNANVSLLTCSCVTNKSVKNLLRSGKKHKRRLENVTGSELLIYS